MSTPPKINIDTKNVGFRFVKMYLLSNMAILAIYVRFSRGVCTNMSVDTPKKSR